MGIRIISNDKPAFEIRNANYIPPQYSNHEDEWREEANRVTKPKNLGLHPSDPRYVNYEVLCERCNDIIERQPVYDGMCDDCARREGLIEQEDAV